MTQKRVKRRVGDIVSIDLGDGRHGFGVVLNAPLIGYFDYSSNRAAPPVADIVSSPIAFRVCTMNHAITRGTWPVIGRVDVPEAAAALPWFFKEDPFTGELTKTRDGDEELPVTEQEAMQMERAAVWDPVHVVGRLRDHFAGVPNKSFEALKPRARQRGTGTSTRA